MNIIDKDKLLLNLANQSFPQDVVFGRGRNSVIEEIKNTPSLWIPCEERQPSQTGNYLVTAYDDRTGYFVLELSYTPTTDGGWYDEDGAQGFVNWNDLVVAWMPLPSPYVPEKEKK